MLGALEEKESALASRYSDIPELQLEAALKARRLKLAREAAQAAAQAAGRDISGINETMGGILGGRIFLHESRLTEEEKAFNAAMEAYATAAEESRIATEAYQAQVDALEEAKKAIEEYRQTINELPGDVQRAIDQTEQFWTDNAENIKVIVAAAHDAIAELDDYVQGVHDSVMTAVESTTKGFEFIGDASQRQAKRLEPLEKELANLDKNSKDYKKSLADIEERTANAKDIYGLGNLSKNLESQLKFLQEYKQDMEKARALGFSNEFLAQFADGSVESAEWLHELAQASGDATKGQVKELNELYASVEQGKADLADTLTEQQLSIDKTYETLAQKAKEAVAALDLKQEAAQKTGETVSAIATEIGNHVPDVKEQVDAMLEQLNRLNGYGIHIDFGGFGSIDFTTSTGEKAEGSGRFGLDYVPHDDFLIRAHEGERLLTAQENQIWKTLLNGGVAGFDLDALGGVMRDNIRPGGNVYLDGKAVGRVVSDVQGRNYKSLQRSGWQS